MDLKGFVEKIDGFMSFRASEQIDYFAFYFTVIMKESEFTASQILEAFNSLRLQPYTNISSYLSNNSRKKKGSSVKYLKNKTGYHLEANFEANLRKNINLEEDVPFINYKINTDSLTSKPSDIPFINNKIKKNAEFFTTMYYLFYHLENSIRKFLIQRLSSILGGNWESELISRVDLSKPCSIRGEVCLTEMLPERGDNILFYCMWDDYAKIILAVPDIFRIDKEKHEILAHLNSLGKIRNAIAHNATTIPKEYQDELTIFLTKYIKILKNNE